jgi:FAD/FMN-containing dehydrogenase
MALAQTLSAFDSSDLSAQLAERVGSGNVLFSPEEIDFYSSDIFDQKLPATLIVRPGTAEQVAACVALCTAADHAVIPRGGGLSYTGGYLPVRDRSVIFDLARLDRIVEINTEDMYVTVEAGVTWHQLHTALKPLGVRTPYWGTVSGYHATIGGGLSQGSTHFGSAEYGTSAESCLGLDVVTADGRIVRTGSASSVHRPSPFFRNYGPDLVGLFLNDTGALGFKVAATLKLIRAPEHQRYLSIAFTTIEQQMSAMAEVSRQRLAAECGGWNPALVRRFGSQDTAIQEDLKYLGGVIGSGSSIFSGLRDAAKIAFAGRRAWQDDVFLMHATSDSDCAAAADDKLKRIEEIAAAFNGRSIPASYPRAHRGRPFADMTALPRIPERTVPTHGICPHSRAIEVAKQVYDVFDEHEALLKHHGISWSLISSTIGTGATLVEPLIHYPDARGAHYARIPKAGEMPARYGDADPDTIAAMRTVRRALAQMFMRNGCVHLQIGKSYPYREGRAPETWNLLQGIKTLLDPKGLMNPGSLGLAEA